MRSGSKNNVDYLRRATGHWEVGDRLGVLPVVEEHRAEVEHDLEEEVFFGAVFLDVVVYLVKEEKLIIPVTIPGRETTILLSVEP